MPVLAVLAKRSSKSVLNFILASERLCALQLSCGLGKQGNLWWGAAAQKPRVVIFFTWESCIFQKREAALNPSHELWKTIWKYFPSSEKELIKFSVPLSPHASHSQRHNIEPNHQLEQLRPLFWCKAAWTKKVPCVYSCNTCMIVGKMEELTTDFQISVFLFPVMSAMHYFTGKKTYYYFFSFCLLTFSCRRAGTPGNWDKSPTLSLLQWALYGGWRGTQAIPMKTWLGLCSSYQRTLSHHLPALKWRSMRAVVWKAQGCRGQSQSQSLRHLPTPSTTAINCWLQPIL